MIVYCIVAVTNDELVKVKVDNLKDYQNRMNFLLNRGFVITTWRMKE